MGLKTRWTPLGQRLGDRSGGVGSCEYSSEGGWHRACRRGLAGFGAAQMAAIDWSARDQRRGPQGERLACNDMYAPSQRTSDANAQSAQRCPHGKRATITLS